jgi:hypothetical protein
LRELALHLLDIAENSITAHSQNIIISVMEDTRSDRLYMSVKDDGVGMDEVMVAKVIDPFVTSRTTRKVGLGIPLLKAAAEACNGWLKIQSTPGRGTRVEVEFQRNHIDRMPLGDLAGTMVTLVIGTPEVHWILKYRVNDKEYIFDDTLIKEELDGIPLSEPSVISFIKNDVMSGIAAIQKLAE